MNLPNPIGTDKSITLADLELGEYQRFWPPKVKKKLRDLISQERESRWEILYLKNIL